MKLSKKKCVCTLLRQREYGPKSHLVNSYSILRQTMFSSKRKWVLVDRAKHSSPIEFNYDTIWISRYRKDQESQTICSRMKRIKNDGRYQELYEVKSDSSVKEVVMYDIPDPVYNHTFPVSDYHPTVFVLRKNNVLSRYDMLSGKLYNSEYLGSVQFKDMSWNASLDHLVMSTSKLKDLCAGHYFIIFKIFVLHPFKFLSSFIIRDYIFPSEYDRVVYGKLKNAEIEGSFLLVVTVKDYILLYSLEDILKEVSESVKHESCLSPPHLMQTSPPVLFAAHTQFNILTFGGFPWLYVRSVSENLLEVRNLKTGELIEGGKVSFENSNEQIAVPDQLTFHMDESNRLVHFSTSDIRILRIENRNGKTFLHQEFHYSELQSAKSIVVPTVTTKNGRSVKRRITHEPFLSRALAFGVESDLDIFFILESDKELVCGVALSRVTFYDLNTYKVVSQIQLDVNEEGDLETNTFMIFMDKDVLSIVTKIGSLYRYLTYRLTYKRNIDSEKITFATGNEDFWKHERNTSSPDRQFFGPVRNLQSCSDHRRHRPCRIAAEARNARRIARRYREASRSVQGSDEDWAPYFADSDEDWNP